MLLNWHHKAAEKWSGVHASTSTPSHTHGKLRDAAKQRKAPKRKLRCPLVVSCSFVSLFHLLLCVLLKGQKRMADQKKRNGVRKSEFHLQQRQRIGEEGSLFHRGHCQGCARSAAVLLSPPSILASRHGKKGLVETQTEVLRLMTRRHGCGSVACLRHIWKVKLFCAAEKLNLASRR